MEITINYLAVILATLANMIIGAVWYSPLLFGKTWMALSGLSNERLKELKAKGMGKSYAFAFVASFIMAFVLAHFAKVWNAVGISGAWQLAFWIWLGFIATVIIHSVLWEGKSIKLYFLNVAYQLVALFAMALILVLWP